jgi:hypothetical protein
LDDEEWAFIRDHTVVGERVLREAPALVPVAVLVRSSHERCRRGLRRRDQLAAGGLVRAGPRRAPLTYKLYL